MKTTRLLETTKLVAWQGHIEASGLECMQLSVIEYSFAQEGVRRGESTGKGGEMRRDE